MLQLVPCRPEGLQIITRLTPSRRRTRLGKILYLSTDTSPTDLSTLNFTVLWANSADYTFMTFFLFFLENMFISVLTFHVSIGDNLHKMSKAVFRENKKTISNCRLLKFLPRMISVKVSRLSVV